MKKSESGGKGHETRGRTRIAPDKMKSVITAAGPHICVELISWAAAALIAVGRVGADVFTSVIHHCTHIVSCRSARQGSDKKKLTDSTF